MAKITMLFMSSRESVNDNDPGRAAAGQGHYH